MKVLNENKHVLINALLFQTIWFMAILGAWVWAILPLLMMLTHLLLRPKISALGVLLLFFLAVIGISFDSILNFMGVFQFPNTDLLLPYFNIPYWLACLWIAFCLTLPASLGWLIKKPFLFAVGCTFLGPISYIAGRRLEALSFSDASIWLLFIEWFAFSIIALVVLFPKLGVSKTSPIFFEKKSVC